MQTRPIVIRGTPLAGGRVPAVCAPLVARTAEALAAEARTVAALRPDLIEWRVDFFEGIGERVAVLAAAQAIRAACGDIPLLFTRRSQREGGQPIPLDEQQVLALCLAVCERGLADAIDYEMACDEAHLRSIRAASRAAGLALVLSHHNFSLTPSAAEIRERFGRMHHLGADVAKLAVMPQDEQDVLTLLQATLQASRALPIPLVSMSMGGLGAVSRLCGWMYGSALSFAVGSSSSAPGQMPIAELRQGLELLHRARGA